MGVACWSGVLRGHMKWERLMWLRSKECGLRLTWAIFAMTQDLFMLKGVNMCVCAFVYVCVFVRVCVCTCPWCVHMRRAHPSVCAWALRLPRSVKLSSALCSGVRLLQCVQWHTEPPTSASSPGSQLGMYTSRAHPSIPDGGPRAVSMISFYFFHAPCIMAGSQR